MMKKGACISVVLVCGCLAGIASGFSSTTSHVAGCQLSTASMIHPPLDSRASGGPSFISRQASELYGSRRTVDAGDASFFLTSRRKWMSSAITSASVLATTLVSSMPSTASAKASEGVVGNPFDAIRYEVSDPKGGVAYLRGRIDDRDFASVMDFTKEYDLVFRKIAMGTAKKRLPKGPIQDKGTEICNAVTFDLIGINRNSRKGQENGDEALRYLDELVQDAKRMIELEPYAASTESPSSA